MAIRRSLRAGAVIFMLVLAVGSRAVTPQQQLAEYRGELDAIRSEFGGSHIVPDVPFMLFGMGPSRRKLFFLGTTLRDSLSGALLHEWTNHSGSPIIVPSEHLVELPGRARIYEDTTAVWVWHTNGTKMAVPGTASPLLLPRFDNPGVHRYPAVLRVLHHQILINIMPHGPVPNYFVYPRPWYRDGAMVTMVLERTGSTGALKEWIMSLRDPYDCNNAWPNGTAGATEPDNLGQALYMISTVSNSSHPLVHTILNEATKHQVVNDSIRYINGSSDQSFQHAVYQTKWLKFGLAALGLPDPYGIPKVEDSYSALFWMAYKSEYTPTADANNTDSFPYLGWACDHFHGTKGSLISNRDYPLTWEIGASAANYSGMALVDPTLAAARISLPHAWHSSEVFLYLWELDHRRTAAAL